MSSGLMLDYDIADKITLLTLQDQLKYLRMPDRGSRCDEMTDEQRKELAIKI